MLLYLTIIPISILLVINLVHVWGLRKHDKVLFEFCQLRRDLMSILRRNLFVINEKDYLDAKELLDLTNNMIHYYNHHKKTTFNFFWFIETIKETRKSSEEIKGRVPIVNKEINNLYGLFSNTLISAFLKYTLFLRSKIIIRLLISILQFFAKISIYKIRSAIDYLKWLEKEVEHKGALA